MYKLQKVGANDEWCHSTAYGVLGPFVVVEGSMRLVLMVENAIGPPRWDLHQFLHL